MGEGSYVIGQDTAANCWLCDRDRGELCHVHDPEFIEMRRRREAEKRSKVHEPQSFWVKNGR